MQKSLMQKSLIKFTEMFNSIQVFFKLNSQQISLILSGFLGHGSKQTINKSFHSLILVKYDNNLIVIVDQIVVEKIESYAE